VFLSALLCIAVPAGVRAEQEFHIQVYPGIYMPLGEDLFDPGFTGALELDWRFLPFLGLSAEGSYTDLRDKSGSASRILDAGFGPHFVWRPLSRLGLKAGLTGGIYSSARNDNSISGIAWGGRLSGEIHLSPAITLAPFAGFTQYSFTPEPLVNTFKAGLGVSINLSELITHRTRTDVQKIRQNPVFPVSYAWYRNNPVAAVRITNKEPNTITEISASFYLEQFMSQPNLCGEKDSLKPGESMEAPITAFFNESMLQLLENISANAKVIVEYRSLGSPKRAEIPVDIPLYHRNAMSWDDNRRAASFVSARDPAAQYFSRYVSSVVSSRMRPGINKNIQIALGMFEALAAYGPNYVIDPSSSYIEMSESSSSLDSLNFPYQTLMYRGGDCDDLAILFSSLMEAAGIETAFITIPGHIYMAFDSGMGEAAAKRDFYAPNEFVYHEGRAWVPLEITIPKDGFYRAWRIGAKEWRDAAARGAAEIYPMHESWKLYPPVSIHGEGSDLMPPAEAALAAAFDRSMDAYIEYEIRPLVRDYELRLAQGEDPVIRNELGVLYGSYGMLAKAEQQFTIAARSGNTHAKVNLGNVAFMQQRYDAGLNHYQTVLRTEPDNSYAILGSARAHYEMNNFFSSDAYYSRLRQRDRGLAQNYSYLVSFFENRGRAYSMADRFVTTLWSLPSTGPVLPAAGEAVVEEDAGAVDGVSLGLPGFSSLVEPEPADLSELPELPVPEVQETVDDLSSGLSIAGMMLQSSALPGQVEVVEPAPATRVTEAAPVAETTPVTEAAPVAEMTPTTETTPPAGKKDKGFGLGILAGAGALILIIVGIFRRKKRK
jgi:tetratricopeptide (TPR) repeat protein